jgi:CubicO group peptidase (beta-lactamase class C family)
MTRYRTAHELGLMEGTPPAPDRLVTLANWQDPPFNRWGFQHIRELIPTDPIPRGDGPVWRFPPAERDLDDIAFRSGRRSMTVGQMLDETATDGFMVLHRGRVVTERYFNGMAPDTRHLLMSVSKSITSTVAGILWGRGELDVNGLVTSYLPELRGTSFEGATVQHLLDMRAGIRFNEDYEDPLADVRVYEQVYLWRPRDGTPLPDDACAYMATLTSEMPHGGPFRYQSILTDVLAWVIERAGGARLADLISREIWEPMGAEFDAEITVDGHGNPMADGGICTTLRDLARFGQLFLNGGLRGRRRIVPAPWIRDIVRGAPDGREAFAVSATPAERRFGAHYRNKWWVELPGLPCYSGVGINGQRVLVHVPAQVVVAKFSTWQGAWEPRSDRRTIDACLAIADALSASGPSD